VSKVRVLIVDDHMMVREGLSLFLSSHPEIEVVGEAANGREAVTQARRLQPDVVLLDLVMPEMDGLEAMKLILQENPRTKVIVLTSFVDDARILEAVQSGAAGFLLKDVQPGELVEAIQNVVQGRPQLHPEVTKRLMRRLARGEERPAPPVEELTPRELEVLRAMAQGLSNREIAAKLFISEKTVKTHVSNILHKLNVSDRTQAVIYALKHKLVELEEL